MRRRDPIVLIASGNFDGLPVDRRLLEEQRLPAAGRFHLAVRPFRDQQIGLDRNGDALQLARLIERLNELPEGRIRHLRYGRGGSALIKPRRRQKLERDHATILERHGALRIADNVGVTVEKRIVKRVVVIVAIAKSTAPSAIQSVSESVSVARPVIERPGIIARGRRVINPGLHDPAAIPSRHAVSSAVPTRYRPRPATCLREFFLVARAPGRPATER